MRDQSVGVNLVGRDVSASKTLKKVGTAADKLKKTFAVAGAAAGAFAIKLGKDSVAAAIADEKSQRMLNYTLSQAGWGNLTDEVNRYITATQLATGVSDTDLRTSMIALTNATGNAAASQQLLSIAMDVSAGTGKDLSTTVRSISKLLVGQRKGMMQLGTGIDATTLKTASFTSILDILESKFSGAAATSAETYAGKMARLREVIGEGQETVGYALIDVFAKLAGGNDINKATQQVDGFTKSLAGMIRQLGGVEEPSNLVTAYFRDMGAGIANAAMSLGKLLGALAGLGFGEEKTTSASLEKQNQQWDARAKALQDNFNESELAKAAALAQAKADAAAAAAAKKVAAAKAKEAAARKKAADQKARELRIAKLAANFDSTLIGINAAKKRNEDKDIAARLDALNVLAQDQAGLPVSDAALKAATTQVNNITVNAGSILTEQELLQKLALSMQAQIRRNDSGQIYWARL